MEHTKAWLLVRGVSILLVFKQLCIMKYYGKYWKQINNKKWEGGGYESNFLTFRLNTLSEVHSFTGWGREFQSLTPQQDMEVNKICEKHCSTLKFQLNLEYLELVSLLLRKFDNKFLGRSLRCTLCIIWHVSCFTYELNPNIWWKFIHAST